jgi:hypothetical protein
MRYGLLLSALDEVANVAARMQLDPIEFAALAARAEHVAAKIRTIAQCREVELLPVITRRPLSGRNFLNQGGRP